MHFLAGSFSAAFPFQQSMNRGILLMLSSTAVLTTSDAVTKWLTQSYPASQVWCLRTVFIVLPVLLVLATRSRLHLLRTGNPGAQVVRSLLFAGTTLLIVTSLKFNPLTDVVAIVFASPLFVAALGPLFLDEHTPRNRWLAILVGFAGVLLIVNPTGNLRWAMLIPVAAAMSGALRDIATRRMTRGETSESILFYSALMVIVIGLAASPWLDWVPVAPGDWVLLLLNGLLNGCAHFLLIEALRHGEASVIAPFKYSGLLWGILLGFLIWGDIPTALTLAGGALIVASGVYIARRL